MVYLLSEYHMGQVLATNVVNIWSGTTNFGTLIGAYISDSYLGRFKTLAYATLMTLLGLICLTLTAVIPQLRPPPCTKLQLQDNQCGEPTKSQLGFLYTILVFLTIGAGGIRPCNLPFGVDQFDQTTEEGKKDVASFFNWYYISTTIVVMIAITPIIYIQDSISWAVGLAIPAGLMFCAIILFWTGTRVYVHVPPGGSVFSGICQVFVAAYKKRGLKLISNQELHLLVYDPPVKGKCATPKLQLTHEFRSLNKAAIIIEGEVGEDGLRLDIWRLCSVQMVEEVKCLIRIIPIWVSGIICLTAVSQQGTFTVSQALTMNRCLGSKFQVPAGSVGVISMFAMASWCACYDKILVPQLKKITKQEGGITLLQRIGIGMILSVLSMIVAGYCETKRRESALSHAISEGIASLSVLWLIPQLALMGLAEAFNTIGQTEFYNKQFPEHMKSFANSLLYCNIAFANYLSSIIVVIVHRFTGTVNHPNWLDKNINAGRLDKFYYLLAVLGVFNFVYFLLVACRYHYKQEVSVNSVQGDGNCTSIDIETNITMHTGISRCST